ncbi:alpha/beta fold hydrolase [Rathayibacter sp. SD072]|uniref:alpha/beta fold hydrolase n=1 Tax=Rathayibacter sp. SD072 TaxID=2781731 RepID=UPI001A964B7A|nr:alpha/beta fold hydrolase [Rathayibacter sp. SD072]MBO0983769.1 alpha/beta fold hydrolase [Rathayibacter sp. SD072]
MPSSTPPVRLERSRLVLGPDGLVVDVHDGGGDGPVVLLLHGVGLSHRPYRRLAAHLAPDARVVALDLPGFGATPKPRRSVPVEEYAGLIGQVLDLLGVASCVAVGHSMGAQFALELALQRADLVSHVVLVGPVTDSAHPTALRQTLVLARDSALEPLTTNAVVLTDYIRTGPRWYFTEVAAMLAYPTHERIVGLAAPLLVVRGSNDPIATEEWCSRLIAAAGGGTLRTVPGHRHVVVHTAPGEVAREILAHARTSEAAAS